MSRPFYTAPSPRTIREEAKQILANQKSWDRGTINLLKNLEGFSNLAPR